MLKITKSEIKLLTGIGVLILVVDILLMKYWVETIKPDPFISFTAKSYRPYIFIGNIIIGFFTFFVKKRISILFIANTIVCYLIFSFFWNSWIENHPYSQTNYHFKIKNRNLRLDISENPNTYGIYELNPNPTDSLKIIEMGMNEKKGDSIILKWWKQGENFEMYFYNNKLIGFPENPKEIELKKEE
ncbi:hypothetical protein [Polaribacter sp. R77954]|uniref:hypothetical protein n=1 Tax=Polaribacter sp. R77954 TaxID=3093870 RepID=UPI0037C82BED